MFSINFLAGQVSRWTRRVLFDTTLDYFCGEKIVLMSQKTLLLTSSKVVASVLSRWRHFRLPKLAVGFLPFESHIKKSLYYHQTPEEMWAVSCQCEMVESSTINQGMTVVKFMSDNCCQSSAYGWQVVVKSKICSTQLLFEQIVWQP